MGKLTGGTDGTCASATDGTADPRHLCQSTPKSTCGTDGICTGGKCDDWPMGTACVAASCSGGQQTDNTCDGKGSCTGSSTTTTACAPYACGLTACKTNCSDDGDCATGSYCSGKTCVAQQVAGTACTASDQCAGGLCGGGYCCSGTCLDEGAASCGANGHCAPGTGACLDYPAGTACPSCSGKQQTTAAVCAGKGICSGGTTSACTPYTCGPIACKTTCTGDGDCAEGFYCSGTNRCIALQSPADCTNPIVMTSGNSGTFGTRDAVCFARQADLVGWGCSNVDGRTVTVNGVATTCGATLPASVGGNYLFGFSSGTFEYASFFTY